MKLNNNSKFILTKHNEYRNYNDLNSQRLINRNTNNYVKLLLESNNTSKQDNKIKKLLQFWTSQTIIPNKPKLTINIMGHPSRLPNAHTCYNQLDLPEYKTYKTLEDKLDLALANFDDNESYTEALGGGRMSKPRFKKIYGTKSSKKQRKLKSINKKNNKNKNNNWNKHGKTYKKNRNIKSAKRRKMKFNK
mgnify:CR=1 FL=1